MHEYIQRNDWLLELGYKNYRAYLRSPLWKDIRQRKLACDSRCFGCGRANAKQVHHGRYTLANLMGLTLKDLYSICKRCHYSIEFTRAGEKRMPKQATDELKRIRRMRVGRTRVRRDNQRKILAKCRTNKVRLL